MKHIIYQILPRLWGKGKFKDIDTRSLSYMRDELGVDCVWLTGIPRHESGTAFTKGNPGSPYAIVDWYDVNPYLASSENGRMHEFELLVKRIHKAGLKVITDYIPNHVGRSYSGNLPHFDYCDGDWTDTLKLNWNSPDIVPKMADILKFWASMGIDGFRCDMVEMVPSDKLGEVIRMCRQSYPDLFFVAEVYGKDNYRRYLEEASIDCLYDKSGFYDILRGICAGHASARELTSHWQWLSDTQPRMLNFLENHDEQRLASPYWKTADNRYPWAALASSLLFNDASFMIYCGQEWADDAAEGAEGRTSIFNWCNPSGVRAAYDYAHGRIVASRYFERYASLFTGRPMAIVRNSDNWDLCYLQEGCCAWNPDRHFAFVRYTSDAMMVVFCNFSNECSELDLRLPGQFASYAGSAVAHVAADALDYSITIY